MAASVVLHGALPEGKTAAVAWVVARAVARMAEVKVAARTVAPWAEEPKVEAVMAMVGEMAATVATGR